MEAARVGWQPHRDPKKPFTWIDQHGEEVLLTEVSPADLNKRWVAAHAAMQMRLLAVKLGYSNGMDEAGSGPALSFDAWSAFAGKRANQQRVGFTRLVATKGLWTRQRLRDCGYLVPAKCELWNLEADTPEHRLWR